VPLFAFIIAQSRIHVLIDCFYLKQSINQNIDYSNYQFEVLIAIRPV